MTITPEIQSFILGVIIGNLGLIVGFIVSLKVSISVLTEKVGRAEKDINGLGNIVRTNLTKEEV